jgi:hypothetical protein
VNKEKGMVKEKERENNEKGIRGNGGKINVERKRGRKSLNDFE